MRVVQLMRGGHLCTYKAFTKVCPIIIVVRQARHERFSHVHNVHPDVHPEPFV